MSHLGFDRNLQLAKLTICIFSIFNELLSTQNVNVARSLARNVSKTFFVVFKHRDLTGPSKKKRPENSINLSGNAHCVHDKNT